MARPEQRSGKGGGRLETRVLTPSLWPDLERLFGKNGACAGCWCMFWRLPGGDYQALGNAGARRALKKLIDSGRAHGVLAFSEGQPVGWCSFERRLDLPHLDSRPSLACDDAERVWSVPCFFVKAGWRRKGVASALLAAAVKEMRGLGARIAEGYPSRVFAGSSATYTGLPSMFEREGFELVQLRPKGRQRMRKRL